jgi:D-beta-D-heptose 7-phosphate kinase/D-beta-D-heptose 1-phosphate adenosyltransferase
MLDEYVWGRVTRISPEAPVPVVEVQRRTHLPGGAGNTAAGVAALQAKSLVCGLIGEDAAGAQLRRALEDCGVDCRAVVSEAGRTTTIKTRVIAHNQHVVRTDFERRRDVPAPVEDQLISSIREAMAEVDAVVISDYAKGVVSTGLARATLETARENGVPVVVDPKGRDYGKYRGAAVLTPNVLDTERAANMHIETYEDLVEAGRRLQSTLGGAHLLVTRGAEGMTLLGSDDRLDVSAEAQDVFDVTGAGDTVAAVLAVALGRGIEMEQAVRLANAAAGVAVGKIGAARVTLAELVEATS